MSSADLADLAVAGSVSSADLVPLILPKLLWLGLCLPLIFVPLIFVSSADLLRLALLLLFDIRCPFRVLSKSFQLAVG